MVPRVRLACEEDLREASRVCHGNLSLTDVQHQQLAQMWADLLQNDSAVGWVIESSRRHELLGFGISCGVDYSLVERYLARPCPEWSLFLLEQWNRQPQVVLDCHTLHEEQYGEQGVVLSCWLGWRIPLEQPLLREVQTLLVRTWGLLHVGYHLRAWLQEAYGQEVAAFCANTGQRERPLPAHPHRHLFYTTAADTTGKEGTLLWLLLSARKPPFRLPLQGMRVAQLAQLFGLTNAQIAAMLNLSISTVGAHWDHIYDHAVDTPECGQVFGEEHTLGPVRGHERRARFLHYATRCPMVLRPLLIGSMPWRLQRNQGVSALEAARRLVL